MSNITIGSQQFDLEKLSDNVKHLIGIHRKWVLELEEKRLEVAKVEAALRDLAKELIALVSKEPDRSAIVAAVGQEDVDATTT